MIRGGRSGKVERACLMNGQRLVNARSAICRRPGLFPLQPVASNHFFVADWYVYRTLFVPATK